MTWLSRAAQLLLVLGLLLGLWAGAASAQPDTFDIEVMVSQVGDGPGGIDPKGGKLHAKLQSQFRYESLKVLQTRRLKLRLDQVGTVALPNGKPLKVRPLQLTDRGLLLAAHVGHIQTDLKLNKGRLVVIDAGRHGPDKLVVSLEPTW